MPSVRVAALAGAGSARTTSAARTARPARILDIVKSSVNAAATNLPRNPPAAHLRRYHGSARTIFHGIPVNALAHRVRARPGIIAWAGIGPGSGLTINPHPRAHTACLGGKIGRPGRWHALA